jgi:hypothetical protein
MSHRVPRNKKTFCTYADRGHSKSTWLHMTFQWYQINSADTFVTKKKQFRQRKKYEFLGHNVKKTLPFKAHLKLLFRSFMDIQHSQGFYLCYCFECFSLYRKCRYLRRYLKYQVMQSYCFNSSHLWLHWTKNKHCSYEAHRGRRKQNSYWRGGGGWYERIRGKKETRRVSSASSSDFLYKTEGWGWSLKVV